MTGLPYGEKSFKIGLAVQTQYWHVTDKHPDIQTRCNSKDCAYALRHAGECIVNIVSEKCNFLMIKWLGISKSLVEYAKNMSDR